MPRIRSITHITGNSNKPSSLRRRRQTNKGPCHCDNCHGKLISKRTKIFHGVSNDSNFGSSSANISSPPIIQLPNEAPEILENDDAELPRTLALAPKIQNQQIFDINPEQSIPNIQEIIDSDEETTDDDRSEEHTSELQSQSNLVCRLLLEKKKNK